MFYTDWNNLDELAKAIKSDAVVKGVKRPLPSDIYGMLDRIEDMYAGAQDSNAVALGIRNVLSELMGAVQSNKTYREAMSVDDITLEKQGVLIKYCALYVSVFKDDSAALKKLEDLCKKFAPDLKFIDVLKEQNDIAHRTDKLLMKAAAKFKEIKSSNR